MKCAVFRLFSDAVGSGRVVGLCGIQNNSSQMFWVAELAHETLSLWSERLTAKGCNSEDFARRTTPNMIASSS